MMKYDTIKKDISFELIKNGDVLFCFKQKSPQEAGEYIRQEINGNGMWKCLVGLNEKECAIRIHTISTTPIYFDLYGNRIAPVKREKELIEE